MILYNNVNQIEQTYIEHNKPKKSSTHSLQEYMRHFPEKTYARPQKSLSKLKKIPNLPSNFSNCNRVKSETNNGEKQENSQICESETTKS